MATRKGVSKAKEADAKQPPKETTETVHQRALSVYTATHPYDAARDEAGFEGLSQVGKSSWINAHYTQPEGAERLASLSKKAQKELWKQANDQNVPLRKRPWKPTPDQWGKDKNGQNLGEYTVERFNEHLAKERKLLSLKNQSEGFRKQRWNALTEVKDRVTGELMTLDEAAVKAEITRREEMALLKKDLYGDKAHPYSLDPSWDNVTPIPQAEPEGALAAIAYPEDYAEAMAYLRAVMAAREWSARCLKLTEDIISMNPAHYTVWLYRFEIVKHLEISILDELAWLNKVSMENLKNYQIWHHRQLLIDQFYPSIEDSPNDIKTLTNSERDFMMQMFDEDAKNYHVWSYRQYLVRKLGMWDDDELKSIEGMIDDDVRNNSAWSHRFFLVFSNPKQTTEDSHATEYDPKVPAEIMDREIEYAKEKITIQPSAAQNQSPWNYLRGVLVKGDRNLGTVREFSESFVFDLGKESEEVRSSHALDLLADIYKEAGETEKADLALRRLGEKWDRIRLGYWEYRRQMLNN